MSVYFYEPLRYWDLHGRNSSQRKEHTPVADKHNKIKEFKSDERKQTHSRYRECSQRPAYKSSLVPSFTRLKHSPIESCKKVQRSERESISKKEKLDFYCRDVEEGVVTKRINYFYELKGNSQDDYKRNYIERESIRRTPICEKLLSEESK